MMKNWLILVLLLGLLVGFVSVDTIPKIQQEIKAQKIEKARGLVQQGWILENQGHLNEAFALYNQALSIDPNCAVAYKHRGTNYARRGAFDKAIPEFEKAIAMDPGHASSYYNLGTLYVSVGQNNNAILYFTKAIDLAPAYAAAFLNRGSAYMFIGQYNAALSDYNRYVRAAPQDEKGYIGRADVEQALGHEEEVLADCSKVLELDPNNKQAADCKERVTRAIQLVEESDEYVQAFKDFKHGDIKEAHTIIEKAFAAKPDDTNIMNLKLMVDRFKDKDGNFPDHMDMKGGDLYSSLFLKTGLLPQVKALLGKDSGKDILLLPTGRVTIQAPAGWNKQIINSSIKYSSSVNSGLPQITVSTYTEDARTSLEFVQKLRPLYLAQNPGIEISLPKEEMINGRKLSYLEFGLKGMQNIKYRTDIYYLLVENMIIALNYENTDYQFEADKGIFHKVLESVVLE